MKLDELLRTVQPGRPWDWPTEHALLSAPHDLHSAGIIESVREHGIRTPVRISEGRVVDGHHRIVAAMVVGLTDVPVEPETLPRCRSCRKALLTGYDKNRPDGSLCERCERTARTGAKS